MSFIDIQLKTDIFHLLYNSNSLISVLLYNSSSLSDSSTTLSGLPHVIEPSRKTEEIDISRIKHTFAPSCCTHFAAVLQQLRTYFRFRFLQQQLWFQWLLYGSRNHAQVSGSMCSGDGTVTFNHIVV